MYNGMPKQDLLMQSSMQPLREEVVERTQNSEVHVMALPNGIWLQTRVSRIAGLGTVVVSTDISELKSNELVLIENEIALNRTVSELRQSRRVLEEQKQHMADLAHRYSIAKEKAEEANAAKANFLANISHELRTPLNAVIGFSEFMMSDEENRISRENVRSYCSDINSSGRFLLDILDDILTMSNLEAGRIRLHSCMIDLNKACQQAKIKLSDKASSKNIRLEANLPDSLKVHADNSSLSRILSNLLSNAIKFSPENTTVRICAYEDASHVVVSIEDEGVGIPQEHIPHLGKAFVQVANCETRGHEGSGLGLAIVRSLSHLHGGYFEIDSTCGVGTLVRVFFPKVEEPVLCD
jgi:two-component system cell cycle sensor histidine kinase PleC